MKSLYSNALFRCTLIVAALGYVTVLLFLQGNSFHSTDPIPNILESSTEENTMTTPIEMGMHINHFPIFSFEKRIFLMDCIIWFRMPIGSIPLEIVQEFSLDNSIETQVPGLIVKSEPIIRLSETDVHIAYHVHANISALLNFKNFPLTDHTLHIVLHNKYLTPKQAYFKVDQENFRFKHNRPIMQWHPYGIQAKSGVIREALEQNNPQNNINYPCVLISLDFKNVSWREIMSLYFPMLVLFFIALFSLLIDIIDYKTRLNYLASIIPILILFRLVIDNAAPNAGYVTHIDLIYQLLISLSLIILLFHIYTMLVMTHGMQITEPAIGSSLKKKLLFMNDVIFMGCLTGLVVCTTIFYIFAALS